MTFSDENWDGYSTPTGSISILKSKGLDKSSAEDHKLKVEVGETLLS